MDEAIQAEDEIAEETDAELVPEETGQTEEVTEGVAQFLPENFGDPDMIAGALPVLDDELAVQFFDYGGNGDVTPALLASTLDDFQDFQLLQLTSPDDSTLHAYVLVPGCMTRPSRGKLDAMRTDSSINPFDDITFAPVQARFPVMYNVVSSGGDHPTGITSYSDIFNIEASNYTKNHRYDIKDDPEILALVDSEGMEDEFRTMVNNRVQEHLISLQFCPRS